MLLGIQPNVPILLLTKLLAYDQAQANTFVIQFMNILKLAKFFENQFLIFFADPFACVLDFDQNFLVFPQVWYVDLDEACFCSEFQGVVYQVYQDLLETSLVTFNILWEVIGDIVDQFCPLEISS